MMHPRPAEVHPEWDGVLILPAVSCPHYNTKDHFSLATSTRFKLLGRLLRGAFHRSPDEVDVASGEVTLWDGTVARSATHARKHLRSLTELPPAEAEPWRRLGNFCVRSHHLDEAEQAFRRALELDPHDVE